MNCAVPSPFGGDLLQLAVYASIALGLLKLFAFRDWEGWWRPIIAALLPTVLIPAALTAVLNAFGMPTPLYGVDGLNMYTVVSSNDLCRNLAVAEYVYNRLESTTLSLVNTYAAATTVLTVIDGILTVITGGAWQALDYAESALRLMGLQNWVNALTQPILAMVYIYMSLTVIWHIVVVMARVALWAPLLISVGVPLVAVRRTRDLGGVAIALAAISIAVSHLAFVTALDVYGMALWGGAFAQNLKNATGGLQINSTAVPYGAPQLAVFGGDGVYYVIYNNTYHASAVQKAMEENPFLTTLVDQYANNTYLKQLAEERRQEYLAVLKGWLNKTSLYAKNITDGVLAAAGPAVGALEWGDKAMNASVWYDWLEMDVTLSVAKCNSLIPTEVEGLFQMGRELNSNVTAMVERDANETCAWLQKANLTDLVFNYVGRYRTLVAGYTYSLSAMWGNTTALLSRSNASGAVGLWDWAAGYGPDREKCLVAGHAVNCDLMNVTASPGLLTYEMPNGTLTWIEPATHPAQAQFNASLQLSSGRPYPTDEIPLYRKTEICTWYVNGTYKTAYRDWWEEYTAKKVLSRANYTLPRPYSPEPWRRPPGTVGALNVTYLLRTWSIDKYWVHGGWYPQTPPYCNSDYFTPETPYKYVVLLHVPQPYVRVVYYWAWLSGANVNVSPSAQPTLPDRLSESEVPPEARPKDGLPADYYLWGAEQAVYCSSAVVEEPYGGWRGVLRALPLVDEINREGLFASLVLRNATASYYQVRQIPSGIQWMLGLVEGTPGQWAVPALEEGLRYANGDWHGYLWHPMPEPIPASYRLYHLYAACIVFEWNSTRWPPGGVKMLGALRLTPGREIWAVDAPLAYSNATLTLLNVTNTMLHHFLSKGFLPPAPAEVCIPVGNGSICGAPYLAGVLKGVYWGGPCPYGVNDCGSYVRLDMFPMGPWGVPLVGNFFSQEMYNTFEVAMAYGEEWKRLIFAGILVLGVFEAMSFLFGFPTPARLLYSVAFDVLSQLGYWMGFRAGLTTGLGRRLVQPIRARLARASRLIAAKLPRLPRPRLGLPSREWLRDPRRRLVEEKVTRRWEEEKRRQIEERLSRPGGKEDWEIRMEEKRRWREEAREALKRLYSAVQAHDVVELARRLSPRVDAFISRVEERLAERHPTLYKLYVLTYRGQYGYLYLLAEPIIRRWEAEGKITRAEADQLRRLRTALWAAAAEAKARAAEAEKGVDSKHLKYVLEYRERYVQYALKELELARYAKTKEELERRLRYAASHLQNIDPKGASRLWEAIGVAAEGRPVGFRTTREVAEFLWERRGRLDSIVQGAKELIAQHYAHAPLSVKDVAREEMSRQIVRTTPLLEAVAKARRYAATGEGVEDVVRTLKAKEVARAARAAEVKLGAVRRAAEKAARLEEERAGLLSKIEELRRRAESIKAEVDALRQSAPPKELEGRQRRLEETYREIEELQQRLSRVEERLAETRRRLAVEAREALERAARSYRGVLEGVRREVDPAYIELRRALLEGRLDETYRRLREQYQREGRDVRRIDRIYQQLKPLEERLQRAREELRAAVKEREEAIRAEAVKRVEDVTYLESLFKALPTATEEDVRRGIEFARQLGLERTAQFLEEYLRHGQARERYASAASEAAVALGRLAGMHERVVKEHQAAKERLRRISLAEDALRRIGLSAEFGQAAKAAREAGLAKTAQFLERWAALRRQAEERGGLEVVNRLGRALAEGRLAEEASAMAAEGKALGDWYSRVLELKPLYEEAVKEASGAKAKAEMVAKAATELKALMEKASAESPADLIARASKLDVGELKRAAEAARRVGLEATAKYFEELAGFAASAKEGAKALKEYSKAERRLKALEAKARAELQKAEKVAEGLSALLEGREYERPSHVRAALKALDEKTRESLKGPLGRLAEARREVELLRHHYTYEVGAPVWRELHQRGVDALLLRAPLSAYVAATLEGSLLREAAEAFRPSFSKYEREAATTVVYLPVSEGEKLGPVISWERAVKGDARPYVEEIAETKAPTLRQAVKDYYSGRGRQYRELAYLEARTAEAVLDVHAARYFLERYAKEGRQEDLALAIALAYRAAKTYRKYQHSDIGQLAEVVAEIRSALGLTGGELKPKDAQEAVRQLKEVWAAVDYRALESRLGLTRTYVIPEPERALEYTAKALTPSRLAALTEGKVAEEAFSVVMAYSLLREFEKFIRGRPKVPPAKADLRVARALERPLPTLRTSAVDEIAREAASRLVREAEALAQRYGLRHSETLAALGQIRELVRISPEAFGELVNAASTARGSFKEWARQLAAEVKRNWDSYREAWRAPATQRLEALRRIPAASEELEAKMSTGLYAELADELRAKLEEAAAKAGIPVEYARYGVVEGAARYAEELGRLASRLPVEAEGVQAAVESLRRELMATDELKLIAELANGNYSTVERIKALIEGVEAEAAKAAFSAVRRFGVRGVPLELLELAARAEFTSEELSSIRAELKAALEAAARGEFTWPQAEYRSSIFATTDEEAARAWARGGGLVVEEYISTLTGPKRVYILAPRNAPIEEIREALYALRGVEVVGRPGWLADWSVAEALGFAVDRTDRGVALRPRVEALIDLERPLPYRREVWEALKRARPDLAREALGVGWSVVHWEDGLAAVNAYLFLRRMARWESFGPADVERALEEYRRRFTPAFERHVRMLSLNRLGFDVVDFLKGAYAVSRRQRGELAVYKPSDPEAYARLIWWAKRNARGSLYELLEPDFRQAATLKALNIAIKGGWATYSEALSLFDSWRRNNDVARWDEEALRIALRGNLKMREAEEAVKRFIESIRTSKQLKAEEVAKERLKLMEEQKRREEEMKRIRGVREARSRAKLAEEARAEEAGQVKREEAERARPGAEGAVKAERPEGAKAAVPEAEGPAEEAKPAEAERAGEEVSYVKLGQVYVKSTHIDNAVVRAFAVEHPENWHLKLTPEAYLELRAGLASLELSKLEAARDRAAARRRALSLLAERYGSIAVPDRVRREAERRAAAELNRWAAALASRHDPEAVEAMVNRLKALAAQWAERASVPNAYDFIHAALWAYEGVLPTRSLWEEWGHWLFREDFKIVKELAERYGIEATRLWNAYRSAVDRYLQVVTSYGDVVKKAVTTIDRALYATLTAAGGVALAEALHGVVRPELVYAATAAASMALAGKYRDAVHVIKTAVEKVRMAVEGAAEGIKLAVERLYEAVVEAAARIVQWLGGHWRAVALIAAAAAAGLVTWLAAHQIQHALFIDHAALLAKAGFLYGKAERERGEVVKEVATEVAEALGRLKEFAELAKQRKAVDPAEEGRVGVEVAEAVGSILRLREEGPGFFKGRGKAPDDIAKSSDAAQLKDWIVAKALGGELRPIAKKTLVGESYLHVLTEEERRAFRPDAEPAVGFWYRAPDVKVGNVEARGVYVLAFRSGETVLRVEILAREVFGLETERVKTSVGELYRLASLSASVKRDEEGKARNMTLTINLEMERLDPAHLYAGSLDEREAEGARPALGLTDLGVDKKNKRIKFDSPDVPANMFVLSTFVNERDWNDPDGPKLVVYLSRARYTEQGLDVELETRINNVVMPTKAEAWGALKEVGGRLKEAVVEAESALLANDRERFRSAFEKVKEVLRERPVLAPIADHLENPGFWLALFVGDGNVDVERGRLGYSVHEAYRDEAELLLRIFALAYGESARGKITRDVEALYFHEDLSKRLVKRLFDSLSERTKGVLAEIVNRWYDWGMPGGSDPPKLVKLLALYELAGGELDLRVSAKIMVVEYQDAVYRRALEKMPHIKVVGERAYVVRAFEEAEEGEKAFKIEFAYPAAGRWELYRLVDRGGEFRLECAERQCRGIGELAKQLKAKAEGGRYVLSAKEGRVLRHLLARRHELSVAMGGKAGPWLDRARVELLEVRDNGDVKFRIWYYRWLDTRPRQPYVDVDVKYVEWGEGRGRFVGRLYRNEAEGIYAEHLEEIAQMLEAEGLHAYLAKRGEHTVRIVFTGGFRKTLLERLGYRPERVTAAEPVSVRHLGGMKFEVGGHVVEFQERVLHSKLQPYTVLQFGSEDETARFYRGLRATGIYAEAIGREVRLDEESYWGLLTAAGVEPEGYRRLYADEGLRVYKHVESDVAYYRFMFKHEGLWRAVEGRYEERNRSVMLNHAEREVLEALRIALAERLRRMGVEGGVGKIGEDEHAYYLYVYRPALEAFERSALREAPKAVETHVEGSSIAIYVEGRRYEVPFKLVKGTEHISAPADLYPALRALGVEVDLAGAEVRIRRDGLWGLLASAIEQATRRGEALQLPPSIVLLKARPEARHYVFLVEAEEGRYVYSVLYTEDSRGERKWTAMGGKTAKDGRVELAHADRRVAEAHAEALSAPIGRKVEVKQTPNGRVWRLVLSKGDLRLMGAG